MNPFVERHQDQVTGVLSCFDRVVITGTLPYICHGKAMAGLLSYLGVRVFDFPRWAEPLREELRENAERLAAEAGLEIEFIRRYKAFRKDERIKEILAERGEQPGLVHIFSAMEPCPSFRPWFDKAKQYAFLKPTSGKCLQYYFYFIDEQFGLCYVRVPTWAPFRLQVYFNGHYWLASQLRQAGISFEMADNAFVRIDDPEQAQAIADTLDARTLHQHLDRWTQRFCPVLHHFRSGYHWSFMQVEYATDVVFRRQADLKPLYEAIVRTAVHVIKAEHVATFLGRKLTGAYRDELGNDFSTRIQGTRIRHHMGPASIKLYDKFGLIARVECTTNDVSFFKHHRYVEQRNGERVFKLAPLRKSIYSLHDLRTLMQAANDRYFAFMACLDNPDAGEKAIAKMADPAKVKGRSFRGFNLFLDLDYRLFLTLARDEWAISGFRAADLRAHLEGLSPGRASYLLKRLHTHGLIKKVAHRYKYYPTKLGRRVLVTALVIREYAREFPPEPTDPAFEVGDIFRRYGRAYRANHNLSLVQHKAMTAIEKCRTEALGAHVDECDHCGHPEISYNSWRNRNCPKCRASQRSAWVDARELDLLPIQYFHLVFTLPHVLLGLIRYNPERLYGLLFQIAAKTLQTFAQNRWDAKLGITMVLHTWGQTLNEHPHVHCIVTGGALKNDESGFVRAPKNFLFPIEALSRVFREKCLAALERLRARGQLDLIGQPELATEAGWQALGQALYRKAWVVYAKRPFDEPQHLLRYLGRYVNRIAIANHCIQSIAGGTIAFTYLDNREKEEKITTPLLEDKYRTQKQLDEQAQHDIEEYIENSRRIVRHVEAKYGFKFKYGKAQGGEMELLTIQRKSA